jgi:hypothetical protein
MGTRLAAGLFIIDLVLAIGLAATPFMLLAGFLLQRLLGKRDVRVAQRNSERSIRRREEVARISAHSLLWHYGNVHSQLGQDGILAEVLRRLQLSTGWFVEFGAWDGVYLSNCRLLYEKGWSGVFIEADKRLFRSLERRYRHEPGIRTINALVGAPRQGVAGTPLDQLLMASDVDPGLISLVSIDVDGADLSIFSELDFQPPVVILEVGHAFSPLLRLPLPVRLTSGEINQPLAVVIESARERGYRPVCFYHDCYLVRNDLAAPFAACPSGPVALYQDAFHFLSEGFRASLMARRASSEVVRSHELAFFGEFREHPLGYEADKVATVL